MRDSRAWEREEGGPVAAALNRMAELINLNRARKARARAADQAQAVQNRALHGRTKAERAAEAKKKALTARELDGARRDGRAAVADDD